VREKLPGEGAIRAKVTCSECCACCDMRNRSWMNENSMQRVLHDTYALQTGDSTISSFVPRGSSSRSAKRDAKFRFDLYMHIGIAKFRRLNISS